jgi:cold shock protein
MTSGVVREWHRDEGWGVVDSPATPGGCWVHFGAVLVPGYAELRVGERVTLDVEPAEQDGFSFRATEAWPEGQEPFRRAPEPPGAGYRSRLRITFGEDAPQ